MAENEGAVLYSKAAHSSCLVGVVGQRGCPQGAWGPAACMSACARLYYSGARVCVCALHRSTVGHSWWLARVQVYPIMLIAKGWETPIGSV